MDGSEGAVASHGESGGDKRPLETALGSKRRFRLLPFNVALALPAQLTVLAVVLLPTLVVIWLSLTSWQPTQGIPWYRAHFTWLANFAELITSGNFLHAVGLTLVVVIVAASVECILALGLALLFLDDWPWKRLASTLILLPMMIVPVDAANSFYMMFNAEGPINYIISLVKGSTTQIGWLGSPHLAIVPIILAEIWQWTPFMFLLILTGMLSIPENQLKAARALGASRLRVFLKIRLPLLVPVITLALVIRSIEIFKLFDPVYIMTQGGPGTATQTISMYMYQGAFVYFRIGYMAAAGLMVLVVVATLTAALAKPLSRG